jgi:hypothetical protein
MPSGIALMQKTKLQVSSESLMFRAACCLACGRILVIHKLSSADVAFVFIALLFLGLDKFSGLIQPKQDQELSLLRKELSDLKDKVGGISLAVGTRGGRER